VVGLGNPGRQYAGTRHNVGFAAVDVIAERHGLRWESAPAEALMTRWRPGQQPGSGSLQGPGFYHHALIAKPLTFMNLSGQAVGALQRYFRIAVEDTIVVVDEVQLELGRLRARRSGSAGGHNGLKSIIEALGTDAFPRIRIGVGRGDTRRDLADHVLGRIEPEERPIVGEAVGRAADAAELFVTDGIVAVMNRFNRKEYGGTDTEDNQK
jgi:PTH1 family peptidyl-tRNA hydrolase